MCLLLRVVSVLTFSLPRLLVGEAAIVCSPCNGLVTYPVFFSSQMINASLYRIFVCPTGFFFIFINYGRNQKSLESLNFKYTVLDENLLNLFKNNLYYRLYICSAHMTRKLQHNTTSQWSELRPLSPASDERLKCQEVKESRSTQLQWLAWWQDCWCICWHLIMHTHQQGQKLVSEKLS